MQQFVGISLKTRLYLVVLAAFIPVAILIVYVAEEQKAIETDAILSRTRTLAQAAADVESLQVEAIRDLMIAVAEAYREVDDQPALLAGLLTRLTGHAERYAVFGILDPAGHLIAGSDPTQMASDYGGRGWLSASLAQKSLLMAPYHGERIDGEPVVYFVQPIAENGRTVVAVAFAALNLNLMNRSIFRQLTELPAGARLNLVDPDGVLLSYDVDAHRWTDPPPLGPELRRRITAQAAGRLVAADANGQSRIYAFARLESALRQRPATVVLEIPLKVALAASQRIFRRNLMLLAISALMAVTAIWWAADRFILRRVGKMVRASRRLAAGDLRARIGPLGIRDELSHLAGVFDEMAAALQVRIEREAQVMASLRRSREQLRRLTAYQNDVREQERIRIAREIHDQLGQSLTILKMDLAWMKNTCRRPTAPWLKRWMPWPA
jgi:HAMP domain-containing protein